MTGLKLSWACLLLSVSFSSIASDFRCPLPEAAKALACEGSIKVKNLNDLISYNSNLGLRKGKAKSLIIDFELNSDSIAISTPCKITLAEKRSINIDGDLCLHAGNGIHFGESSNLHANNVRFESHERIIIGNHADIKVENMELVSLGTSEDSRVHIRHNSNVSAKNLLIEASNRLSLGVNSTYAISENLVLYSRDADDTVVKNHALINAGNFVMQANNRARIENDVTINGNYVVINAYKCEINKKNSIINSENKFGNCFLESTPNGLFKINANNGFAPHTVEFDASKISSKSFEWNFGDGETLSTTNPINTHQYNSYGWFDVKLRITDAVGAIVESTTPIYVYDPEVDAPGDEGFATIEGVDIDNDGVRDDVQRWINKNSFESAAAKKAFRELASVYNNQIANSDDMITLQTLEDQKATVATCVDNEIIGEHNVTKSAELELVYLNSNERMMNFAKIRGNLSGYVPKVTVTSATDACAKWR